jgi:hypothetical protein
MVEKELRYEEEVIKRQILEKALMIHYLEKQRGDDNLPLRFKKRLMHIIQFNRRNALGDVKPESASGESGWKGLSYELMYDDSENLNGFQFNVKLDALTILHVPFERKEFVDDSLEREVFDCLLEGLEEGIHLQDSEIGY